MRSCSPKRSDGARQLAKKIGFTLMAVIALCAGTSGAQKDDACQCRAAFDNLLTKLETNYLKYQIEIRGKREAEYRRQVERFRVRADQALPAACVRVLQEFVAFFQDGHLFIGEYPRLSAEEKARLAKTAETVASTEKQLRDYLDANRRRLDPIEGIWYAKDGQRFGIRQATPAHGKVFVAFFLSGDVADWRLGQVKARFRKLADSSYDATVYARDHSPRHPAVYLRGQQGGAALRRGLLLHLPPATWGKAYPLSPAQEGAIDPSDPRRPTMRALDDSTLVVSVPSHDPQYASVLRQLLTQFEQQLAKAETLIIDLRGDEGGSSQMTRALLPLIVTPNKRPSRYEREDRSVVLASPDNLAYFEQIAQNGWPPKSLIERMRANPGVLVRLEEPGVTPPPPQPDVATAHPRHVAILMDGAIVSAGEAFVLAVMRNEKVTLFGQNTGGVIDYQSVRITEALSCPQLGLALGYPTIAASDRLPAGGVNRTGIAPDVRIGREVKDPLRWIQAYYARNRKT